MNGNLTRREFSLLGATALGTLFFPWSLSASPHVTQEHSFVHPGLLHSAADLARIKAAIHAGTEPIATGFEVLRKHPQSQATYVIQGPFAEIGRNPTIRQKEFEQDANAAYQCALMWCVTGERAYANKARTILLAWAKTLRVISGADAVLCASLHTFKLVNAAELLRYTATGWTAADTAACLHLFRDVFYPVLKDCAPFANGNWDTAAVKTNAAIAVFSDDRDMFERAFCYYVDGAGDGRLTNYIYANGQCQESGRDQSHTQLGLAHLGDVCEIAWQQGLDLYSYADNRLLRGFEYTASYNLGNNVEFVSDVDCTGKYRHPVISPRGPFRPVYEQIYNHYENRAGIAAPFTRQVVERIRPEGAAQGADHPGFGTVLFGLPGRVARPARLVPPAGLIARGRAASTELCWIPSTAAQSYVVRRSVGGGSYQVIADNVRDTHFTDTRVEPGTLYSYTVSAKSSSRTSAPSVSVRASAGLPKPWSHRDVGRVQVDGWAGYDGERFFVEGAGASVEGAGEGLHYAWHGLDGDGSILARFVPQVASQFVSLGVAIRENSDPGSPGAMLVLTPRAANDKERPLWHARLDARKATGAETTAVGSRVLTPPQVVYGRLLNPVWLRLKRAGNAIAGAISFDGKQWENLGTATLPMAGKALAGLMVCSGIPEVATRVTFDHVQVIA